MVLGLALVLLTQWAGLAHAETLEAMDAIVARAKDLDEFLSRTALVDEYYEAAAKYYGGKAKFPRGHFDQILTQMRGLAANIPGFKERAWETTGAGETFSIASEAPSFARNLNTERWDAYKEEKLAGYRTAAGALATLPSEEAVTRVNEIFKGVSERIAEFERSPPAATGSRRARTAAQAEFYRTLLADDALKIKNATSFLMLRYLESDEAKRAFGTESPDLILNFFRELQAHPERAATAVKGIELPSQLASEVKRAAPTTAELTDEKLALFPRKKVRGKDGKMIPVEPGRATEYAFKVVPRRFHGAFKGLPAGECVGGGCTFPEFNGTPERWATSFLKDSHLHYLEVGGKYEGFIQQVPLKGPDGTVVTVDYGTPILRQGVMRRRGDGTLASMTLFSAWLREAEKRKPPEWKGFLKNGHYSFNNSGVVPVILSSAEYLTADKAYTAAQLSHLDPMAALIVAQSPGGGNRDTYRGNMITESTAKNSGNATLLKPSDTDLFEMFRAAFARRDTNFVANNLKTMAGEGQHLFKLENFLIQLRDANLLGLLSRHDFHFARQQSTTPYLHAVIPELIAAGFTPTELRWVRDVASWNDNDYEFTTREVAKHLDGPEPILEFLGSPKQHPTEASKKNANLIAKNLAVPFIQSKPSAAQMERFLDVVRDYPGVKARLDAAEKKMEAATKGSELIAAYHEALQVSHLGAITVLYKHADRLRTLETDRDAVAKEIGNIGTWGEYLPVSLLHELQTKLGAPWQEELRSAIDGARTPSELTGILLREIDKSMTPQFPALARELERGALKLRRMGATPHDIQLLWDLLGTKLANHSIPAFLAIQRLRFRLADSSKRWLEVLTGLTGVLDAKYIHGINANLEATVKDFLRLNPSPKQIADLFSRAPHGWPTVDAMTHLLELELNRAKTKQEFVELIDIVALRAVDSYKKAVTQALENSLGHFEKLGAGAPELTRLLAVTQPAPDSGLALRFKHAFREAAADPEKLVATVEAIVAHYPGALEIIESELLNAAEAFHAKKPRATLYERLWTALVKGHAGADWARMERLLAAQLLYADTIERYTEAGGYYRTQATGSQGANLLKRVTDRSVHHLARLRASPKQLASLLSLTGTHFGDGAAATILGTKLRESKTAAEYLALVSDATNNVPLKKARAQAMTETLGLFMEGLDATADLLAKAMPLVESEARERLQSRWKQSYVRNLQEAKDIAAFLTIAEVPFATKDPVLTAFATKTLPEAAAKFHSLKPGAGEAKKLYDHIAAIPAPDGILARGAYATTANQYLDFVGFPQFLTSHPDAVKETLGRTVEHFLALKPLPSEIAKFFQKFPPDTFPEAVSERVIEWGLARAPNADQYHAALAVPASLEKSAGYANARHRALEKTLSHYDSLAPTARHDLNLELMLKPIGGPLHDSIAARWRQRARAAIAEATTPAAFIAAVNEASLPGMAEHVLPVIADLMPRFPEISGAGEAEFKALRTALGKINPGAGTPALTELNHLILLSAPSAQLYLAELPPAQGTAPKTADRAMIEKLVADSYGHFIKRKPTIAESQAFEKMVAHITVPPEALVAILEDRLTRATTPEEYIEAAKWLPGLRGHVELHQAHKLAVEKTLAHWESLGPWIKDRLRLSHEAEPELQEGLVKTWKEKLRAHLQASPTAKDFVARVEEALAKDLPHAEGVAEIVEGFAPRFKELSPSADDYQKIRERLAGVPKAELTSRARLVFSESPTAYLAEAWSIAASKAAAPSMGVAFGETWRHFLGLVPTADHTRETTQLAEAGTLPAAHAVEILAAELAKTQTAEDYLKLVARRDNHTPTAAQIIDAAVERTKAQFLAFADADVEHTLKLRDAVSGTDLRIGLQQSLFDRKLIRTKQDYIAGVTAATDRDATYTGKNAKLIMDTMEEYFFKQSPTPADVRKLELQAHDAIVIGALLRRRLRDRLGSPTDILDALGPPPEAALREAYDRFLKTQLLEPFFKPGVTLEQVMQLKHFAKDLPIETRVALTRLGVTAAADGAKFATLFDLRTTLPPKERAAMNAEMKKHLRRFFGMKPGEAERKLVSGHLGALRYFASLCGYKFF